MTWLTDPLLTERLLLRPMEPADEDSIAILFSDVDVRRYLGGALTPEVARRRASVTSEGKSERFWGQFSVVERASGSVIGMAGFDDQRSRWQLNYEFRPEWWGRGLALEATAAILKWFWSQKSVETEVIAVTQVANESSCRLLAKLGAQPSREFVEFDALQREYVILLDVALQ